MVGMDAKDQIIEELRLLIELRFPPIFGPGA
jgi:hypothetical protein